LILVSSLRIDQAPFSFSRVLHCRNETREPFRLFQAGSDSAVKAKFPDLS
jgi:hypothetical protein